MSSAFGKVLVDFVDKGEEGDRGFVDVESFVLEVVHDVLLEGWPPKMCRRDGASGCAGRCRAGRRNDGTGA
jgi:hypothetical protein